jgi:hypothetical protein
LSYYSQDLDSVRLVKLSGEAQFEVKHMPEKPFKIETSNSVTRVLGTKFLLKSKLAIDSLTLINGKVQFLFDLQNIVPKSVILKPGESFSINSGISRISKYSLDSTVYVDCQNSIIYLKGANIFQITSILEEWYNVKFVLKDNQDFSGKIVHKIDTRSMDITEVIEGINLVSPFRITKNQKNEYIIAKK